MHRLAVTVCFVLLASDASAQWWRFFGAKTYEECMIKEMRGQAQSMYLVAHKVCATRHSKEVEAYVSRDDYTWNNQDFVGTATIVIKRPSEEHNITRLRAQFSNRNCKDSNPGPFTDWIDGVVTNNVGKLSHGLAGPGELICMRGLTFFGFYK